MASLTGEQLDVLITRIEKLWRKANDPGVTAEEREAFETKALSLMERHRINEAMIDIDHDDPLADHFYTTVEGRYGVAISQLVTAIAAAYGCRVWWRRTALTYHVYVFGFRRDAERVFRLADFLRIEAFTRAGALRSSTPASTFAMRRSFVSGFTSAVRDRFAAAARLAHDEARRAADDVDDPAVVAAVDKGELVLVERERRVDTEFAKKRISTQRPSTISSERGWTAGVVAGRSVPLSDRDQVTASRRELAS